MKHLLNKKVKKVNKDVQGYGCSYTCFLNCSGSCTDFCTGNCTGTCYTSSIIHL